MKVQSTENYEQFQKHKSNRDLNELNVVRIMNSIKAKNLLEFCPILVNQNMEVIDGQHRLEAAKRLKVPIFWNMLEESNNKTVQDIVLLNANQKNWDLLDYLNYYANEGIDDYLQMRRFMHKHKLTLNTSLSLLFGGGGGIMTNFKEGSFKFPKEDLAQTEEKLWKINQVIQYIDTKSFGKKKYLHSPRFFRAISCFLNIKDIDFSSFMTKLEYKLDLLRPCTRLIDFMEIFKEIYNFKNRNPIDLKKIFEGTNLLPGI